MSSRERIATAMELDPRCPARARNCCEKLRVAGDQVQGGRFKGEACERYTAALKRARGAVAATCSRPRMSSCASWSRASGALRGAQGRARRPRLRGPPAEGGRAAALIGAAPRAATASSSRHLMVDEFQDTNGLQLALIEQLRGPRDAAVPGRRRVPVDLRLPARGRRGLPREHRRFAEDEEAERRGAAADGQLPRRARAGRRDQRHRVVAARRVRAAHRLGRGADPAPTASSCC